LPSSQVTVVIIPGNTSRVRQLKFSRAFIAFMACFFLLGLGGVTILVHKYLNLKKTVPATRLLEREVAAQRGQIQAFARKIRKLNSHMMALQQFEKKIRIVANLEEPAWRDALFGIGGPIPEDLNLPASLTENHSSLIRQMHAQTENLQELCLVEKQSFEELHSYLQDRKSLLASTPAIRPARGWLSSSFGYRISPFTGLREFHRGIDIAAREGTPIIAPADGVVTFTGRKGGLGKLLVIDHGHGMVTRYGHLKKWLVKPGTRVKRGQKIALLGNTGRSTGPHLHYEVHLNGIPVNPLRYILN